MTIPMKHVTEPRDLSAHLLSGLFELADEIYRMASFDRGRNMLRQALAGETVFGIYYRDAILTQLSFAAAARLLGMDVRDMANAGLSSSARKGESLSDMVRVMCGYGPAVIILQHPRIGAATEAAMTSTVPILNAGEIGGHDPVQAIVDLYTIQAELGRLTHLNVVMVGNVSDNQAIRSTATLLARYPGNRLTFVAPAGSAIGGPDDSGSSLTRYLDDCGVEWSGECELDGHMAKANVVYVTPLQYGSSEMAVQYRITPERLGQINPDAMLLGCLPRAGEIDPAADKDRRSAYFEQAINARYVKAALLYFLATGSEALGE